MKGIKNETIKGKVSEKEIIYIAGLFDGEGCVNIYKIDTDYTRNKEKRKVPKWVLSTTIYNCHYETIKWLYDSFGGYLQTRNRNPKTWRTNYAWKLTANSSMEFLKRVLPYLKIKQKQAQVAIKFQANQSRFHKEKKRKGVEMTEEGRKFREKCWLEIKSLNHNRP